MLVFTYALTTSLRTARAKGKPGRQFLGILADSDNQVTYPHDLKAQTPRPRSRAIGVLSMSNSRPKS